MLRNLASSLFLTERDAEFDDNKPKVPGRVVTTLHKAKEVRPIVEKCITIARRSLQHEDNAEQYATSAKRESEEWRTWRASDQWQQWCEARAPVVAARRRALRLLGDKQAVRVLFEEIAPRFVDRDGGYTRVLKLSQTRLGDAGKQAILELVGAHDRVSVRSEKPTFSDDDEPQAEDDAVAGDGVDDAAEVATDETAAGDAATDAEASEEPRKKAPDES